jgi:hypothetical protein
MYYRIAIDSKVDPAWKWKSSVLGSINLLLLWLRSYQVIPRDRLRIFAATSADALNTPDMPAEDQALWATSVPASQFLRERGLASSDAIDTAGKADPHPTPQASTADAPAVPATITAQSRQPVDVNESGNLELETRRYALEAGVGGDHDCPYRFSFPTSPPQLHAWIQLWLQAQTGDQQQP